MEVIWLEQERYEETTVAVLSGMHKGSVLGSLLFIYVNDLASLSDLVLYRGISTQSDYCVLRNDVAVIESCSSTAHP